MKARGLVAHTRYAYARLLLDWRRRHPHEAGPPVRAGADPVARTRSLLDDAAAAADTLGMTRLARLAAAAIETAPAPVAPSPPAGLRDLSRRELDVLRLLVRGATNHEIGAALYLSPDTVRKHTITIYRKLDVRGRAEATAWAVRHGLEVDEPPTSSDTAPIGG